MRQASPLARRCWFVKDSDYNAYDTLACVGNLKKAMESGKMLTEEEILALQVAGPQANMEGIQKPSRKWTRGQRKLAKR